MLLCWGELIVFGTTVIGRAIFGIKSCTVICDSLLRIGDETFCAASNATNLCATTLCTLLPQVTAPSVTHGVVLSRMQWLITDMLHWFTPCTFKSQAELQCDFA